MRRSVAAVVLFAALISGCAHKKRARLAPPPPSSSFGPGYTETGIASWYGHPYHGRPAASGEIYDMEQLTAAHRTLPFNTWVRIYDLDNGKTVDVRINDRGPFVGGRIIDLSHAAARDIAMIGPGTAKVRLEVIRGPEVAATPGYFAVQVGAFRERRNAERLRDEMERKYGAARMVQRAGNPSVWRVLVGLETSEAGAGALAERIRHDGGSNMGAFVVRVDSV